MKKKQNSITLDAKAEDIVQTLRIDTLQNIELSYNQIINMLVKEALKSRNLL